MAITKTIMKPLINLINIYSSERDKQAKLYFHLVVNANESSSKSFA